MRMSRQLIAVCLLATIPACTHQNHAGLPRPDYFPLSVGDTWTYRTAPRVSEYTNTVTETRAVNGITTYAMVIHNTYSFIAKRPDGIYDYGDLDPDLPTSAMIYSPPELLYKMPFLVGGSWDAPVLSEAPNEQSETDYRGGQVQSEETVATPAGVFAHCMKVIVDDPRELAPGRSEYWFAPNVGIVKVVTLLAVGAGKPHQVTDELIKYDVKVHRNTQAGS